MTIAYALLHGVSASAILAALGDSAPVETTYRYWRIQPQDVHGTLIVDRYFTVAEVELLSGGVDQTGSGTASAWTTYGGAGTWTPAQAIDNNPATNYGSAQQHIPFQWWQYDALSEVTLDAISLQAPSNSDAINEMPSAFYVLGSHNGREFDIVDYFNGIPPWTVSLKRTFNLGEGASPPTRPVLQNPGAHRYWRLVTLATKNGDYAAYAKVELKCTNEFSDDLTPLGGTPSASSQYNASYSADKAFDNLPATSWSCARDAVIGSWLKWDFGAGNAQEVRVVRVRSSTTSGDAEDTPLQFRLEYSDDDTSWTAVKDWTTPEWPTNTIRDFFATAP